MLPASRRDLLLDRLHRDGRLVAGDLAAELGISEDSIRRDLRELAAAGLLTRVYGGALPVSAALADYSTRTAVSPESKRRVAVRAAALVLPGTTVILDGGTTTLEVVRALPRSLECTVVTHSPTIAAALLEHAADVFVLGGRLFKHSAVTSGAAAAEAAARIRADVFLLGVTGVHPVEGLTTGDPDEAAMKRALAARAADTYVLASTEKIGAVSPYDVLPLGAVTAVVADRAGDASTLEDLRTAGVDIIEA
jgi:DeoR/GlpR family transcriptional regulator of sugar metabolism